MDPKSVKLAKDSSLAEKKKRSKSAGQQHPPRPQQLNDVSK